MNIKKLCEDSHRISKDKGWLEDPRPFSEIAVLFHSELSEAMEDYRNHHPVTEIYYEAKIGIGQAVGANTDSVVTKIVHWDELQALQKLDGKFGRGDNFLGAKPCGIPIELADFIIRLAQYCGTNDLDLDGTVTDVVAATINEEHGVKGFGDTLALLHADVSMAYLSSIGVWPDSSLPRTPLSYFVSAWLTTFAFCSANGIDLSKAIAEKQAYNETRPHRHGGKKC